MSRTPYPHQVEAARFLASRNRACLFDDPGVGKTGSALLAVPAGHGVLVVCPAVAKTVWEDEVRAFRPDLSPAVLAGRGSFRWPRAGEVLVTNYELLPARGAGAPYGTVLIADEAHYLKSWKSRRSRAFRALSSSVAREWGFVWLLTGSPLLRDPYDLWNVLAAAELERRIFRDFSSFRTLFGAHDREIRARGGKTIRIIDWGKPAPMVRQMLSTHCLRRTRLEVMPWLPPKTWTRVRVPVPEAVRKTLDEVRSTMNGDLEEAVEKVLESGGSAFEKIASTRAALAQVLTASAAELADSVLDSGRQIVVFSVHRGPVDAISSRPGWRSIRGGDEARRRAQAISDFQGGEARGIAATIGAAGTAVTLTAASDVIFVDLDWSGELNRQAEDRVCRPGQKEPVEIRILEPDHEVMAAVHRVLRRKAAFTRGLL